METMPKDKTKAPTLLWNSFNGKTLFVKFDCHTLSKPSYHPPAQRLHMRYKMLNAEMKLLTQVLQSHGLQLLNSESLDFNLHWTGIHPKTELFTTLMHFQKINHFPRSSELTRKDCIIKNIANMKRLKRSKRIDFMPETFVMPHGKRDLHICHNRERGPWIIKPIASYGGRGIEIIASPNEITIKENVVVSKYIDNPFLIDGFKWDIRLYVAVTSYNPLLIYLYGEGVVRLASVKYEAGNEQLWNPCMHLCNYSLNKHHADYNSNQDSDNIDGETGNKRTLSGLLRRLKQEGKDTAALMVKIEDIVVKSILAASPPIISSIAKFVRDANNCFELYGFDILVDDNFKPWLLEVNVSPSLGCETSLDMNIKSSLMVDLLNLVGLPATDPMLREIKKTTPDKSQLFTSGQEDVRLIKKVCAENTRSGNFLRIFPSPDSWERYSAYLDSSTGVTITKVSPLATFKQNFNLLLHHKLFPKVPNSQLLSSSIYDRMIYYERTLDNRPSVSIDNSRWYRKTPAKMVEMKKIRDELIDAFHHGKRLNQWQTRKMFSQYFNNILNHVAVDNNTNLKMSNLNLIFTFLQRVAAIVRSPYNLETPCQLLKGKDREAVMKKLLFDLLTSYCRETESAASKNTDVEVFIPDHLFLQFMSQADVDAIQEMLTLHTDMYDCAYQYLGRCGDSKPVGFKMFVSHSDIPLLASLRPKNY